MKFARVERWEPIQLSARQLSIAKSRPQRRAKKLAEAFPLLADQIPTPEPYDAESDLRKRQALATEAERKMRATHARQWRDARRNARAASPEVQALIKERWAAWAGPLTPINFGYVVDVATGVDEERSKKMRAAARQIRAKVLLKDFGVGAQFNIDFGDGGRAGHV